LACTLGTQLFKVIGNDLNQPEMLLSVATTLIFGTGCTWEIPVAACPQGLSPPACRHSPGA
jgi:hypothetical protein